MDFLEIYRKDGDDVQAIYRSGLTIEILLSLNEGSKKLSQLREISGSSSQSIIPNIRRLESGQLVEAKEDGYCLTRLGKIVASRIADSFSTIGTINKHKLFWSDHCLEDIPISSLKEIGCLYNSEIISDTHIELFNVYRTNLKIIKEAGHVVGVSSVVTKEYADSISEKVCEGIPVELIVPMDVAEQLKQEPYVEKINALKDYENFKLMVMDGNIRVGLIVTDKCLSLGLYKKDGVTYDIASGIFSFDPMAVVWGERLFEYYKEQSKVIKM
ncbi:helix-turn-helix transcriptional regulator [Methanococcoides burtonii]|uniref:Transcriptional regulator n=1 Tax=Methanococcoides burtonii (strain DSM 6242 / NBRC 107633 / OCM 468 / ACE-M) TaxID=259564 RepID=Q12WY6_METBU|nr:transcriptional regulator FilR1 domain-containing protein [Methanococcoides burtonii]ABE52040.1 transcriptional regulator [Methanococcoides burtonii DSM 6242]